MNRERRWGSGFVRFLFFLFCRAHYVFLRFSPLPLSFLFPTSARLRDYFILSAQRATHGVYSRVERTDPRVDATRRRSYFVGKISTLFILPRARRQLRDFYARLLHILHLKRNEATPVRDGVKGIGGLLGCREWWLLVATRARLNG